MKKRKYLKILFLCLLFILSISTICFAKGRNDPLVYDNHGDYFERLDLTSVKSTLYEGQYDLYFELNQYSRQMIYYLPVSNYVGNRIYIYNPATGKYKHYYKKYAKIDPAINTAPRDDDEWMTSDSADRAMKYLQTKEPALLAKVQQEVDSKNAVLEAQKAEKIKKEKLAKESQLQAMNKYEEIYNNIMSNYLNNESSIFDSVTSSNSYFFQTSTSSNYRFFPEDQAAKAAGAEIKHLYWAGNGGLSSMNLIYSFTVFYVNDDQTVAYVPIYITETIQGAIPDDEHKASDVTDYSCLVAEVPLKGNDDDNEKVFYNTWFFHVTSTGDIHYYADDNKREGNFSDYEKNSNDENAKTAIMIFYREARPIGLMKMSDFHKNEWIQTDQDKGIEIAKAHGFYEGS